MTARLCLCLVRAWCRLTGEDADAALSLWVATMRGRR